MDEGTLRRWEAKIEVVGECWLWKSAIRGKGYSCMKVGSRTDGSRMVVGAHRLGYEHFIGPIPEGLHLDHLCRTRHCVNPAHLEPVTNAENSRRGARGRLVTSCVHGHPYDEENTRIRSNGRRACRTCSLEQQRRRRAAGYIAPSRRK